MAKISDMPGRFDGSYTRLFGDERRGHLISQIHAAAIRAGTELQKYIEQLIPPHIINTIDAIVAGQLKHAQKEIVIFPQKPRAGETPAIISDFAIFIHPKRHFMVVELKDGDTFDTQKSPAIKINLQSITDYLVRRVGYSGHFYVCAFNALDPQDIVAGFKNHFDHSQVLTGPELCRHLGISYQQVLQLKLADQEQNRRYFDEMTALIRADADAQAYANKAEELKTGQLSLQW
jgi:hypothetical protein